MSDFRLKVFYTVARRLNFTKAAEELFITQPAVTKHIHELEKQFEVKLFERVGSRVALTQAGGLLLQHAAKIFAAYKDMNHEMALLSHKHSGTLCIGASTTIAHYVLPGVLAQFNKLYADVQPEMSISNTEQVEKALEADTIDLGVIEGHTKNNLFKYTQFIKDELVLIVRLEHPLARKQTITIKELLKQPLLLRESGSGTLEVLAHSLKLKGISLSDLNVEMKLGSTESMKLYLQNTDVVAFLSVHSVFNELQQNRFAVIDVTGLNIERYFYFIEKKGQEAHLAKLFIDFALNYNFR